MLRICIVSKFLFQYISQTIIRFPKVEMLSENRAFSTVQKCHFLQRECFLSLWGIGAQSTYICRVQSRVWRLPKYWPPTPPSPPSECVLPPHQRRGEYTLAGRWWGWGFNILEGARHRIGFLPSNSIISLRIGGCITNLFSYSYSFPSSLPFPLLLFPLPLPREGRCQSINFHLLKFTQSWVQRHSLKLNSLPPLTLTLCMHPDLESTKLLGHPKTLT